MKQTKSSPLGWYTVGIAALFFAGFLLLVALLVSTFWLTLGIVGFGYILTIPVSGWFFVRARNRYAARQADQKSGWCA